MDSKEDMKNKIIDNILDIIDKVTQNAENQQQQLNSMQAQILKQEIVIKELKQKLSK